MRRARLPLLVLLTGVLWLDAGPARGQVREPALKAAFVYNFILFTTWPAGALQDPRELRLCVDAGHALATALEELRGKPVGERRVGVYQLGGDGRRTACDVAVVGAAGPAAGSALATALVGDGVLTISDGGSVGANGAAIVLVRDDSRIRFDVDGAAAARARLALSSRLLRLARRVL